MAPLLLSALLNPINATMVATALPSVGRSFGVGTASTVWLVAGLYVAAAIAQPTAGRLADVVGPRRVLIGGLALVAAAGALGALATSFTVLVLSRVLLGLGTATGYPAAIAAVRRRAASAGIGVPNGVLGAIAVAGQTSLAIGPLLGGLLVGLFGWRAIFAVNVPLGTIGLVLMAHGLPRDPPLRLGPGGVARALDLPGIALFAATVAALLVTLMLIPAGISAGLVGSAALTLLAGSLLVRRELRRRDPFVDVRMLAVERGLTAAIVRHGATYVVLYGVLFGFAQWLEEGRGLAPTQTGLVMLPMLIVGALTAALAARTGRVRWPLAFGTVALVAGSLALMAVGARTPVVALVLVGAVFGLPSGLNFAANQLAVYAHAPAAQIGSAAGLFRTAMYVGAVVASTLIALAFDAHATDAGLHALALSLTVAAGLVLLGTVATWRLLGNSPALPVRRGISEQS